MAIRATITALSLLAGLFSFTTPTVAIAASQFDLCASGHAPAGWKRPGGYCDIAADLNQHSGIWAGHGAGGGGGNCIMGRFLACDAGRILHFNGNAYHFYEYVGHSDVGIAVLIT